ncbi:major facilitator superfamily domain-containing protein [Mariannaea sp. PMI_226]|nr:major facilitator superfamily domain-containing protein [Mariannaea sp. PMI_226]
MSRQYRSSLDLELEGVPDTTPFLDSPDRSDGEDAAADHRGETGNRFRFHRWGVNSPRRIVLLVATIKFLVVMSGMLLLVPYARLIEDAFCHVYYEDESSDIIEEMKCKTDEIQSRMGYLFGWAGLCSSVIGLLVAFPYGMMSDKIGRKPTVIFSYAGVAFSMGIGPFFLKDLQQLIRDKPYILLIGSIFQLFGGGIPVLLSTLYAIAADVSSEEEKATHFLYLTFGATAGGIMGPMTAGLIMQKFGPWVPIYIVAVITPVVFATLFLLPETLTVNLKNQQEEGSVAAPKTFKQHMIHGLNDLAYSLQILRNKSVPLILVTFFVQNARFTAYSTTISQYLSKHFQWRLHEVSILLSPLGFLNLIILASLPKVAELLMSPRFRMTAFQKDLFMVRIATIILVVGSVVQGLSHNIVLFLFGLFISTFGSADSPLARATITHYVDPEYTSRLYALIGMVEVMGSFIAGPVLAWCFDIGLKRKGLWIGLPWFYVGFLCSIAMAALWFVKAPKKHSREEPTDTDGDDTDEYLPDDPLRLE